MGDTYCCEYTGVCSTWLTCARPLQRSGIVCSSRQSSWDTSSLFKTFSLLEHPSGQLVPCCPLVPNSPHLSFSLSASKKETCAVAAAWPPPSLASSLQFSSLDSPSGLLPTSSLSPVRCLRLALFSFSYYCWPYYSCWFNEVDEVWWVNRSRISFNDIVII